MKRMRSSRRISRISLANCSIVPSHCSLHQQHHLVRFALFWPFSIPFLQLSTNICFWMKNGLYFFLASASFCSTVVSICVSSWKWAESQKGRSQVSSHFPCWHPRPCPLNCAFSWPESVRRNGAEWNDEIKDQKGRSYTWSGVTAVGTVFLLPIFLSFFLSFFAFFFFHPSSASGPAAYALWYSRPSSESVQSISSIPFPSLSSHQSNLT